jgi:hypothetical protein
MATKKVIMVLAGIMLNVNESKLTELLEKHVVAT